MSSGVEISLSIMSRDSSTKFTRSVTISMTSLVLVSILLLALFLRWIFFVGHGFADDMIYSDIVHRITEGNAIFAKNVFFARTFFIYAMSFFSLLLGYGEFSLTFFQLLCSLGEIVLIYHLGCLLINRKVGFVAALLLACYPLNIIYSTRVMPDIPLAFFLGLNVYFLLKGEFEDNRKWYALSGASLGLAYMIKGVGLVQVVPIAVYMITVSVIRKRIKLPYLIFTLSVMIVFLLEMIYFKINMGHFLGRFLIFSETYTKTIYQGDQLWDVIHYYPKLVTLLHHSHFKYLYGLFFYISGFMLIYYTYCFLSIKVTKRNTRSGGANEGEKSMENRAAPLSMKKSVSILLIWLFFWIFYLQFGSMSLSKYVIIEKHERFLSLITIPFLILLANFLTCYSSRVKRFFNLVSIVVLLITSVYFTSMCNKFHSVEIRDSREIKEYLEGKSYERIYADRETNTKLNFLFAYEKRRSLIDLNKMYAIDSIKGNSYIITHGRGFRDLKPSLRRTLSHEEALWKQGWKLEKIIGSNILEGFKDNKLRIFYLP